MKITSTIRNAIIRATPYHGDVKILAEKAGILPQNISRYRNGKTESMETETWEKIYPHLKTYLPEEQEPIKETPAPYNVKKATLECYQVPILGRADAAQIDPQYEPLDAWPFLGRHRSPGTIR